MAAGVRMHSFAEKDPTLEDVFMLVTKGLVARAFGTEDALHDASEITSRSPASHVSYRENPVLQRELLVNLRMNRAFVLLLAYVVLLARWSWPPGRRPRTST